MRIGKSERCLDMDNIYVGHLFFCCLLCNTPSLRLATVVFIHVKRLKWLAAEEKNGQLYLAIG